MEERKDLLLKSAMTYGLGMGIFWVIKYIFFIFSLSMPSMGVAYWLLTLMVPLLHYRMTKLYRADIGGKIGFFHAWRFGMLLYFFAALIVSLAHYAFYRYIAPPDFVAGAIGQMTTMLRDSRVSPEIIQSLDKIRVTPIQMTIQGIFNNVFYGIILSIPIAALVCRNNSTGTIGGGPRTI